MTDQATIWVSVTTDGGELLGRFGVTDDEIYQVAENGPFYNARIDAYHHIGQQVFDRLPVGASSRVVRERRRRKRNGPS